VDFAILTMVPTSVGAGSPKAFFKTPPKERGSETLNRRHLAGGWW